MQNIEILEKAIQKAIDGGWMPYFAQFDKYMTSKTIIYSPIEEGVRTVMFGVNAKGYIAYAGMYQLTIPEIVYDHDFAKALFGESISKSQLTNHMEKSPVTHTSFYDGWQYHLQQMVVAPDPIAYLGEHI